jgi:xanthine dehydrogenase molybdopterin-binding subunit B
MNLPYHFVALLMTQIAETQKYAHMAAKQALIEYSTENLELPILTIEDAIKHNSYFHPPPSLAPKPFGDFREGMHEADHKILSTEVRGFILLNRVSILSLLRKILTPGVIVCTGET